MTAAIAAAARPAAFGRFVCHSSTIQDEADAPAQRTSVSCCESIPEPRMTFETVPLIANSVAATVTIAYPAAVCRGMPEVTLTSVQRDVAQPG